MTGASTARHPAVEARDVHFAYGPVPAVEGVSLSVAPGEFLGLVGPNGSGKTTLLKLLLGLLEPDRGETHLFGEPAREFEDGRRLGYVSQSAAAVDRNVPLTVRETVTLGRVPHAGFGRLGDEDREAVERAMETVGVGPLCCRRLGELSGGQRQRVFVARALAADADLLVLDEPAVGIDAESRDAFYGLLSGLNDRGMAVLLVEHDIGVVTAHADRVACIDRTVHYHGDPEEFLDSDAIASAYGSDASLLLHDHE